MRNDKRNNLKNLWKRRDEAAVSFALAFLGKIDSFCRPNGKTSYGRLLFASFLFSNVLAFGTAALGGATVAEAKVFVFVSALVLPILCLFIVGFVDGCDR